MLIRKTEPKDLATIDKIYSDAKEFMKNNGNPTQWQGDYPNATDAEADMKRGIGYVCEDEGRVVAVFAFAVENEPDYDVIYDGEWLNNEPYAYIHRVAVAAHGRGIVDLCLDFCYRNYPNIKIDTHKDNLPMQRVLKRNGFVHCGTIKIDTGEDFLAFQKA